MADTDQETTPLVFKQPLHLFSRSHSTCFQETHPLAENMPQSKDHQKIDIPEEGFEPGPECCIYKVPKRLREVKETAYTPYLISIGPVHHDNKNLAGMERQKQRYCEKFCERTSKRTLEEFSNFIKKNVQQIYWCYDEFVFEKKFEIFEFVTMILRDAVFIIELFLRKFENKKDFLLEREWLHLDLWMDLILLENQLPFSVLKDLYNLEFGSRDKPSFLHLACNYFRFTENPSIMKEIRHFTDLARCVHIRNHPSNTVSRIDKVYNAMMLYEAGVDFEVFGGANSLLDVRYGRGELRIPLFSVGHRTEALIRNLMALEHCHYPEKAYYCSYIQLLDHLVDTEKDVDLLVKKGIFVNLLGSSAALADMINSLMVGIARAQLPPCYDEVGKDLNQYYENSGNHTMATLWHVYFNNIWRGTATVAAFIVVLLTLTQTILAILERAKPTK